jgi:hypothetical protein
MNIVKLKDILMPSEYGISNFFNENLKGKYAYWIQMRYIFPLNSLDYKKYKQYEQYNADDFLSSGILPHIDLYSEECSMLDFAQNYIDHNATELANSITNYKVANDYVADYDIDINKLRKFRSWLANELLILNTDDNGEYLDTLNNNQIHMLDFYKNNMYNEIVKQLSIFGVDNSFSISSMNSQCGCCNNTSDLVLSNTSLCNALDIYIKNLHNLMVQTFEDVNFWMQFNKEFIVVFKKYIDNIIKTGMVVKNNDNSPLYYVCSCNNTNTTELLLKNLSDALQYIINDDIKGHLNFIHDALYNWAEQLYDKMSWEINN